MVKHTHFWWCYMFCFWFLSVWLSMLRQNQKGFAARSSLFKRGGPLACELARHPVVLRINDWVFCHGGLLPHHGEPLFPPIVSVSPWFLWRLGVHENFLAP
jgi:hypothetical protein